MPPDKTPRERAEDLIRLLVPDWRPTARQGLWAVRIGIVLGLLVAIGYSYGVTLWDWIKLLVVPAVIAGGGLWFNAQQRKREREIANDRAQDEALQAYLDHMSQLITDKERPLHKARPRDNWSTVARARTFTALGRLDSSRKRSVMQFLYESGLIYKEGLVYKDQIIVVDRWGQKRQIISDKGGPVERQYNIVSLEQADLRVADLSGANLLGANLRGADLGGANLSYANLGVANLIGANLFRADLSGANLSGPEHGANLFRADLRGADLGGADLSGTNLRVADLSGANLRGADLTGAYLEQTTLFGATLNTATLNAAKGWTEEQLLEAHTLEGATMPNGRKYEDWLKSKGRGEEQKRE